MDERTAFQLFVGALALLGYTYAGYPVLILALERILYRPVRKQPCTPPVTVLLPAYNEEHTIGAKLENLLDLDYPPENLRIVVATDGATDRTAQIVRDYADRSVVLHEHPVRRGKAMVLNDEVPQCETDIVVLVDARQRLAPDALRALAADFADPQVGAASGELVLQPPAHGGMGRGVGLYWRYEKRIRKAESGIHSTVGATGALLAFRRALWRGLPARTVVDDMVLPFQIVRQGYRVVLEEDALVFDRAGDSWEREFVRKSRTLAGNFQILRHPMRMAAPLFNRLTFQYLSHKVLRLLGPLALVVLFWSNYFLLRHAQMRDDATATAAYNAGLLVQGLAYAGALVGFLAERLRARVPLASLAYSFVLTQVAVVCGFLRFGSGRDDAVWERTLAADAGGLYERLVRLVFDSVLFCFGIAVAFYVRYGGAPPRHIFQLYENLIPRMDVAGTTIAVPLVMLVPLTVLYFFRVNERRTMDVDPEFVLRIIHAVAVCTLVVMLLIYKFRTSFTIAHEGRVASFPTMVLLLSFVINSAALSAWRLGYKALRYSALSAEGAWRSSVLFARTRADAVVRRAVEANPATPTRLTAIVAPEAPRPPSVQAGGEPGLNRTLVERRADELLVAAGALSRSEVLGALEAADRVGAQASLLPGEYELLFGATPLQLHSYIPVTPLERNGAGEPTRWCKRTLDCTAGLLFMIAGLPGALAQVFRHGRGAVRGVARHGRHGRRLRLLRPACPRPRPSGWTRRGLRKSLLGWHLLKGDLALVGPPALTPRAWRRASALERRLCTQRPGLVGPRRVVLVGRTRLRRALRPALVLRAAPGGSLELAYTARWLRGLWPFSSRSRKGSG